MKRFFAKNYVDRALKLVSEPIMYLRSRVALDESFQSEERWKAKDKTYYITSLITGQAPSKIIIAHIENCMSACKEGTRDWEYYKKWHDLGFEWISIDGNNRTITIDEFLNGKVRIEHGEYCFGDEFFVIDDRNDTYDKMPKYMREWIIDNVNISITEYKSATRADLSSIFSAVNYGVILNNQEQRNAKLVPFADFVRSMKKKYTDVLIKSGPNNRRKHDQNVVEFCVYSTFGPNHGVTTADMDQAYEDDSLVSRRTKAFETTMDTSSKLLKKYAGKEFKKGFLFSLYIILDHMRKEKITIVDDKKFYDWFISSENRRIGNPNPIMVTKKGEMRPYSSTTSTLSRAELTARYEKIMEDFNAMDDGIVSAKDPVRLFNKTQRYEMWIRQNGVCPVTGQKILESEINDDSLWHADHIIPHSKGGKTIVENGQLISREENLKKSNKMELVGTV